MPFVGILGYHNKYRQLSRNGAKGRLQFRDFSTNPVPGIRKGPGKWTPLDVRLGGVSAISYYTLLLIESMQTFWLIIMQAEIS